ncbi:MAG: SpoIVB peptidase S55 domain-containing protein [Lachnospiraceae bacterium]
MHVTDHELLEMTGGIVQDMSGSPSDPEWKVCRCR